MNKKKWGILCLLASGGLGMAYHSFYRVPPLFYERFQPEASWEKQCTKSDIDGQTRIPAIATQTDYPGMQSKDGMLYLDTGIFEHTGGGEWRKAVEIDVGKNTAIEWQWAACDAGDYQFWIRIRFDNHRAIFYQASGAKPPGAYRHGKWTPHGGETFRDRDGRRRFLPSAFTLVRPPGPEWVMLRRNLTNDYLQCYGDLPAHLAIVDITIGMVDDSPQKRNALGIEYIKIG